MANVRQLPVLREQKEKRRGSRKLLWILLFLFVVLLVILFFQSSISKVDKIEIRGLEYLTDKEVRTALGVQPGDQFFGTSSGTMIQRLEQLKTVSKATVHKNFPGYILVEIQEQETVAFQLSSDNGKIMAILANGSTVLPKSSDFTLDKPVLSGWDQHAGLLAKLCSALSAIPDDLLSDISEIKPAVSIAYPDKLKLYTKSKFEVITTISYLPQKAEYMNSIIAEEQPGRITLLEADTYTPYAAEENSELEKDTTQ